MTIVECLTPFMGTWRGVNRLRILPTDEYRDSGASATIAVAARDFVTITYTWSEDDKAQDGLLLLGGTAEPEGAAAVWADSWHSAPAWMNLSGNIGDDGVVRLTGSYAAPSGPDWGWQVHIDPGNGSGGRITMHNVVPGESPYQAVEVIFDRRG